MGLTKAKRLRRNWYWRNVERARKYQREWKRKNWNARPEVRAKRRIYSRKYRKEHPRKTALWRWHSLLSPYRMSPKQYQELLDKQDKRCAICRRKPSKRRLHVDHDHKTKRNRGLLCFLCNSMLGHARDNETILQAGIDYLRRTNG